MSSNIKIGNDTVNGVTQVRFKNADVEDEYVSFVETPSGNQDITTLNEYDVSAKATARISATERAKIIAGNIKQGVTILGVTGTYQGTSGGYTITCNITNGTYSGSTATFGSPNTAQIVISPNTGYNLPSSSSEITVVGASKSYNSSTGIVTLTNATGNITVSAECPFASQTISGVYVINSEPDYPATSIGQTVSFTSDLSSFNSIHIYTDSIDFGNTEVCYYDDEEEETIWEDGNYRTINFGSTAQNVSQEFYDWLSANSTH